MNTYKTVGDLKRALADVPDSYQLEVLYIHADMEISSLTLAPFGKALTVQVDMCED